jgi:PAS domain S-box-containing protein
MMSEERLRVLLVDDETSLREPLAKRLRTMCDYRVDTAANGAETWHSITESGDPYDVVLIDDMLTPEAGQEPELLGVELVRKIRERCPETECIVFTGWGMERALEALRAGAYRYLSKPLNLDELGMTIRMAAEHRRLKQQLETTRQEKEWLQTFLEIGRATTSVLELEQVLEQVHEQVGRLMDASGLDVVLYDESSQTLRFELGYDRGERDEKWERPFSEGQGLTDWVITQCEPLLVRDYPNEETPVPAFQKGELSRSWLGVPLVARGGVIGAITVQSYLPDQFDETDQQILATVASQVANGIENARLFSELSEAKEWREALIENAFDAVIAIDQDRRITVFNQRAEEMTGWTAEEMVGQTVARLHDDIGKAREILEVVSQRGVASSWEVELKHREGIRIPALLSAALLQDREGQSIGQAGFMRDLRQVKLLEERLRALNQLGQIITSTLELEEVLDLVVKAAMAAFPMAQQGSIHLYDERKEVLNLGASTFGDSPSIAEATRFRPGEGIAGWVFQHRRPAVVEDAQTDERYKWIDHPEVPAAKSIVCVPLDVRRQVIGTLSLNALEATGSFQAEDLGLLRIFAAYAAIAIDNARFYEETRRRQQLLAALDEASRLIRAEKETDKLLHQVVRLAARLVNCEVGSLFINWPHLGELALSSVFGLPVELVPSRLIHAKGLAGRVARTGQAELVYDYCDWLEREEIFEPYGFCVAAAVPLKQAGVVEAVLLVADNADPPKLVEADLEILERFAVQAAIALQTSRLISREQRRLSQLGILHQISDYIQAAGDLDDILRVVLTGVTAGYGLGFNRAALLLDEPGAYLVGRMGVGHLAEPEARRDWELHHERGLEDFQRYLELLEQNELALTPVGERILEVRLPVTPAAPDLFSQVLRERRCILVTQEELERLPASFVKAFEPALPFIVAPLLARDEVIGLLVADNKFSEAPITSEDEEALLTFANTAAIAIKNAQLDEELRFERERLRSFYEASNALVSSRDLEQVLRDIVERAQATAQAHGVCLALIDHGGQVQRLILEGVSIPVDMEEVVRKDGLSMAVMRTGEPVVIEDTRVQQGRVNPGRFWNTIGAALCLPAALEGERFGVMWFYYEEPRRFAIGEIEAVQLYVNQAALAYDSARRIRELEQMRQAAEALAGSMGIKEVLKRIAKSAREVLEANSTAIWSYDSVRDRFIAEDSVAWGIPEGVWQAFRQEEPRLGRTALAVMEEEWIGVRDVGDIERYSFLGASTRELFGQVGVKSFQGVALRLGDENLGVLYANYDHTRYFGRDDEARLRTFAGHAALALKNARLLAQMERTRRAAEVIASVTVQEDLKQTLETIVKYVRRVLGGDGVSLYAYNEGTERCDEWAVELADVREPASVCPAQKLTSHSVVWSVLNLEGPNYYTLAEDHAAQHELLGGFFVDVEEIRAAVGIQLRVSGRKMGVMFVNYRSPHRFAAEEIATIQLFADQAAVAIRNARLFQGEQRYTEALKAIQTTSAAVSTVLELDDLLPMITERAAEIFEAPATSLMLWDGREENLVIQAAIGLGDEYCREQKIVRERVEELIDATGLNPLVLDIHHAPVGRPELVQQEGLYTALVAPLTMGDKLGGVLNIYSRHAARQFEERELELATIFANHAAIAIRNAQLFQQAEEGLAETLSLQQVAMTLAGTLELEQVLNVVMMAAMDLTSTDAGSILFWDPEKEVFTRALTTAGPQRRLQPYSTTARREGGIARTIVEGSEAIMIPNARDDPRISPVALEKGRLALIGVPLMGHEETIGVLFVSSAKPREFSERQVSLLEGLASQATVAIERAHQYEELKRTKGLIGARTALAWMGMASSAWRHTIDKHALTIGEQAQLLRGDLSKGRTGARSTQRLAMIERLAKQILEKPIVPPLSREEGTAAVAVNEFVRERAQQLWQNDPYKRAELVLDWQLPESAAVEVSPEWLRRALDILVDNAVEAIAGRESRRVTIGTRAAGGQVEVFVSDTGPGIPEEIRGKIGLESIEKPEDARGMGKGLLMAQTIVHTYGGEIQVASTGPTGTTMVIRLSSKT